jgi:hypothetical protein
VPTPDDVNLYINWAILALVGRMAEADTLLRQYGASIRRAAAALREVYPFAERPLYRGVLLDPAEGLAHTNAIGLTFVSWSEDRDVARWFGSRESFISEPIADRFPRARGYVLTMPRARGRVLFHHTWVRAFQVPLHRLAAMHPQIGPEGAAQLEWALRTQHEVVLEPMDELPTPEPIENVPGLAIPELDRRLSPPWLSTI